MQYSLVSEIMKIIIKREEPIRLYHHPRDVTVRPKSKKVDTFNSDGSPLETFDLIDKEVSWDEDHERDLMELILTLNVK
ncbi:MAG: hypothetical protein ACR2LL_10645 [Nitrosopumilus sp.]